MLTCCSCWNLHCCGFLLLPSKIMWRYPAPKWILREFDVSRIRPRIDWVTSPRNVDVAKFDLSWEGTRCGRPGYPPWRVTPPIMWTWSNWNERLHGQAGYPPPRWVTMPTWGPHSPCKQALKVSPAPFLQFQQLNHSPFIIWVNLVPLESHF